MITDKVNPLSELSSTITTSLLYVILETAITAPSLNREADPTIITNTLSSTLNCHLCSQE